MSTILCNADFYLATRVVFNKALVCDMGAVTDFIDYEKIPAGQDCVDVGGLNVAAQPLDLRIILQGFGDSGGYRSSLGGRSFSAWSSGDGVCPRVTDVRLDSTVGPANRVKLLWCPPLRGQEALDTVTQVEEAVVVLAGATILGRDELIEIKSALARGKCLLAAPLAARGDWIRVLFDEMRFIVQRCGIPLDEVVAMSGEHIANVLAISSEGRIDRGAAARFVVFTNQLQARVLDLSVKRE